MRLSSGSAASLASRVDKDFIRTSLLQDLCIEQACHVKGEIKCNMTSLLAALAVVADFTTPLPK
jgi:hypothetical protein